LLGVVSPVVGRQGGVALIAIDGSPAKAYPVGATVWGELQLQSVHQRGAALGPRGQPASVTLELAALPPAATGSLPPALVAAAAPVGFAPAAGVAADTAPGMPALGGGPVPAPMPMAVRAPGGAPQAMPPGVPAAPGALMDAQGRFVAGARPNGGRNPVLRPPGTPAAQPPQNPVPEPTMENVR
jgi:general secretion pathway protein C